MGVPLNKIDDYFSKEISKIKGLYETNNIIVTVASLSFENRKKLYNVCIELERHNCKMPLLWAIQDFDKTLDYGGSAYYVFIKSIIDIYKNPTDILENVSEGNQEYQDFLEVSKELLKGKFCDFFISYGFELSLKIIELIDDGNQKSKALRTWQLFSSSSFNSNKSKISDLKYFREGDEFNF